MAIEECNQDVFERGVSLGFFDMSKEEAEALCKSETIRTGCLHDWHYVGGRVHMKMLREPIVEVQVDKEDKIKCEEPEKVGSWS